MEATLRIKRYVKNQPGQGILMSSQSISTVTAFCYSHWTFGHHSRKSITGYLVRLGDSLINYKSEKQSTVSKSLVELEYISMASTLAELIWFLTLLKDLEAEVKEYVSIYTDSKAAMQSAVNSVYHEKTKHIEIDCHLIRENINQGLLSTSYIPTKNQLAYILTKGLHKVKHHYLSSKLGVCDIFSLPILRGSIEKDDQVSNKCRLKGKPIQLPFSDY